MTTITITDVISGAHHLKAKEPLVFEALYDEDAHLYFLRDNPLGIQVTAPSSEKIADAIRAELAFMWPRYALEDGDKLTPAARVLKRDLLETFEVVE